jgi:GTP cyclohydrolase I
MKRKVELPDVHRDGSPSVAGMIIDKVGIKGDEMSLKLVRIIGGPITVLATVDCYVSGKAEAKGINMSRIPRTIRSHSKDDIGVDTLKTILENLQKELFSIDSYIKLSFKYPIKKRSLKSEIESEQFYDCVLEGHMEGVKTDFYLTVDVMYSSACPCSFELSGALPGGGVPHSQRSVAKIKVKFNPANIVFIEELIQAAEDVLRTPVQVIVKREDEQEFARLNQENLKFAEDAVRLVADQIGKMNRVLDYVVVCEHFESLHRYNALAAKSKGIPRGLKYDG